MLGEVLEEWLANNSDDGFIVNARVKTNWSWKHWILFNSLPIDYLLQDPYFFGWRGNEMYETHRGDILKLFSMLTPVVSHLPGTKKKWDFTKDFLGLPIPARAKELAGEFFENNTKEITKDGMPLLELQWGGEGKDIRVYVAEEGTRSGKTWKAGTIYNLLIYKNIIIPDYKIFYPAIASKGGKLGFSAMSRTEKMSKDRLFQEVMIPMLHSNFFLDYFPPNVTLENIETFKNNPGALKFPKGIAIETGSGMGNELENLGYTLIGFMMDEANFYEYVLKSIKRAAEATRGKYDAAELAYEDSYTRIDDQFNFKGKWAVWALMMVFSSAGFRGDLTQKLIKQADDGDETIFYTRRSVWEARPHTFSGLFFDYDINLMAPADQEKTLAQYRVEALKRGWPNYEKSFFQAKDTDLN